MQNHRKIFSQGLNADDDFSIFKAGQWINAENIRTFTTDSGATGRVENVGGTALLFNALPAGTNRCIGGCEDESKKRILFFNWNANGDDGIYCYDKALAKGYKVLMSADVTGGLNFSRYAYIHSCFIANGNLYWVNGTQNEPRRINIEAGIKAYDTTFATQIAPYTLPVSPTVISWIRRPGAFPPVALKGVQSGIEYNYLTDGAFQFCYRYNFRDNEFSTLSALSNLCNYNAKEDTFNKIDVSIPLDESIEQDVKTIDLVVRNVVDDSYFIIKTWDKNNSDDATAIASHQSGSQALSYTFYNATTGEALDAAYKVKPFDSFPNNVGTCELAKNRAFIANYTEGYDTPKETSLQVALKRQTIGTTAVTTVMGKWYKMTFDLEIYFGNPGFPSKSYVCYVLATTTTLHAVIPYSPVYYWELKDTTVPPYPASVDYADLNYIGPSEAKISDYFREKDGYNAGNSTVHNKVLTDMNEDSVINTDGTSTAVTSKAFKSGSSLELGVTFYDQYQRKCGIRKMTRGVTTNEVVMIANSSMASTTAGHTVTIDKTAFDTAGAGPVLAGDVLVIFGSTAIPQQDYNISAVAVVGTDYVFTVLETVTTLPAESVFSHVLRPVNNGAVVAIPDSKITNNFVTSLDWSLENTERLNEIPDWAYYYAIGITKCLTTRFFMDGAGLATYAVRNETTGLFDLKTTFADASFLLVESAGLEAFGMGYTFSEGDIIKIISAGVAYTVAITGAEGKYILVQPVDIGVLNPTLITFEIITPHKRAENEPFYETGEMFAVISPGTSSRQYSTLSGQIGGDVYLLQRSFSTANFVAEAMSPNDKYWKQWNTNTGRPNIVETIGQVTKTGGRRFSNTFIEGTKVNGLSSFEALNEDILDVENGAIQKLQLANKIQFDGSVLLNICENETVSTYLGEQEMFDTQGSAFIAKANSVLGSSKSLKGSLGTRNPESVFESNGLVFWWDATNDCAVQYSTNGLFSISKNKFVRPANLFSKKYSALTPDEIIALGSNPYVIGGFDPYHKEALFTIPATEATPPKGFLVDYPTVAYPYDIYDGKGKTLMYKSEADIWLGDMTFEAEKFIKMDNDLYSFKDGCLYIHNQNTTNFYGVPFKARLMYANNPGAIHTFLSIGLESNKKPSWAHFRTEDPYVQSSDLPYPKVSEFKSKEGVISASLVRDRLSPNAAGNYNKKQITGDRLFGKALLVMLEYEFINDPAKLQLRISNVGNNVRSGTLINTQ